jgi:oxygen-dependent protoporphyrinogen oxidase
MRDRAGAATPDAELLATVASELSRRLGARAAPLWSELTRWPRAIPQYTLGHFGRIAEVERAERDAPGLFFCANYRGGISISDCIKSAHSTAAQVREALGMVVAAAL